MYEVENQYRPDEILVVHDECANFNTDFNYGGKALPVPPPLAL